MGRRNLDVLIVDDDTEIAESVKDSLELRGHRVRIADGTGQARSELLNRRPDVVLSDFHLGGETSESALRYLATQCASVRTVLMSGSPKAEWKRLLDEGVVEQALQKPFELEQLISAIERND